MTDTSEKIEIPKTSICQILMNVGLLMCFIFLIMLILSISLGSVIYIGYWWHQYFDAIEGLKNVPLYTTISTSLTVFTLGPILVFFAWICAKYKGIKIKIFD